MTPARTPPSGPTVSVVVPCFDVEPYVDECIASALRQTCTSIQVVAIDDGSTDGTGDRLRRWASTDERVEVVEQPNRGLGAARNAGLHAVRGRYITFLDGDDLLTPDALTTMVAAAESSGADIVSAVADQFDVDDRWRAAPYGALFERSRSGVHIARDTSLVYDQMACSKLFRRSFWEANELRFREGVLYEDVEVVMLAHSRASSAAVVSDVAYLWRRRGGHDPSITQDRYRPGSVEARFAALERADAILRDEAGDAAWNAHAGKILLVDVRMYAQLMNAAPPGWSAAFVNAAADLLDEAAAPPEGLTWPMRRLHRAVAERDVEAAERVAGMLSGSDGRVWSRAAASFARLGALRVRRLVPWPRTSPSAGAE